MLDTNVNEAHMKLLTMLAKLMCEVGEIEKSKNAIYINSIIKSYKNFTDKKLLAEISHYNRELEAKKASVIALINARKAKSDEAKAKRDARNALKNQPSPSRGKDPIVKTLKEAQDFIRDDTSNYIDLLQSTDDYVPPRAQITPPGGGKSYNITTGALRAAKAVQSFLGGTPVIALTPNHNLIDEIVEDVRTRLVAQMNQKNARQAEIETALSEVVHYKGRQPWNGETRNEFTCFQHISAGIAGQQNQPISASLCHNCPNGRLGEILHGPQEHLQKNINWFTKEQIEQSDYEGKDCQYLRKALPAQLKAKILVAPTDAFSDGMNDHKNDDGSRTNNLVIVDESVKLNRRVEIQSQNIVGSKNQDGTKKTYGWLDTITSLIKYLTENEEEDDVITNAQKIETLVKVTAILHKVNLALASGSLNDKSTTEYKALAKEMSETKDELQQRKLTAGGVSRFEKIKFSRSIEDAIKLEITDHFYIPLRAFCDLVTEMEAGRAEFKNGSFSCVIHVPTQIAARALNKGRMIFLDATMPLELQELVESRGGEVVRLNVAQNLHVTKIAGVKLSDPEQRNHHYGKGLNDADAPRRRATHIADMLAYSNILKQNSTNGKPWGFLTHKAVYDEYANVKGLKITEDNKDIFNAPILKHLYEATGGANCGGVKMGWFNRHDRGHNKWKRFNIAIFGQVNLSAEKIAIQYESAQAMMQVCGNHTWGDWDKKMTEIDTGCCIPIDSDDVLDKSGGVLVHGSKARLWYLNWLVANLVQGIGRARAVSAADAVECVLLGGIDRPEIDAKLEQYGIKINARMDNTVHITKKMFNERGVTDSEIDEVIKKMTKNGESVSRDKVIAKIKSERTVGARNATIDDRIRLLREAGLVPQTKRGRKPAAKKEIAPLANEIAPIITKDVPIEVPQVEERTAYKRIALKPSQKFNFAVETEKQIYAGLRNVDEVDEVAKIKVGLFAMPVYKIATDYYIECTV